MLFADDWEHTLPPLLMALEDRPLLELRDLLIMRETLFDRSASLPRSLSLSWDMVVRPLLPWSALLSSRRFLTALRASFLVE